MRMNDLPQGEKYIKSHRFHKRCLKMQMLLSFIVVLCTIYALILPAITMENKCPIPEHTHTETCYTQASSVQKRAPVCTPETLGIHQHTADCYGANGESVCGYADFVIHTHDSECYDESGELWCPFPEIAAHEHTDSCYTQSGSELICDYDDSENHTHGVDCYDADGELRCSQFENKKHEHSDSCYVQESRELVCGKEEIVPHYHTETCYDETGSLICGKQQVQEHQHENSCFYAEEVQSDSSVLICGLEEHTHTASCYTSNEESMSSNDDTIADSISAADVSSGNAESEDTTDAATGMLNISLLYGDQASQSSHPDGVSYYTHTNMSGYIKLEPSRLEEDLIDVTVTLTIPKQYVEKDAINIPPSIQIPLPPRMRSCHSKRMTRITMLVSTLRSMIRRRRWCCRSCYVFCRAG